MSSCRLLSALAAALSVAALATPPALAAPSRAELEQSVIQLQEALARAEARLNTLESRGLTGDPVAVTVQQRMDAIQSELARVVGELEEARYQNARLQNELRTLKREIQLRDAEIAERLGLEPAFAFTEDLSIEAPGLGGRVPAAPGGQVGFGDNPFGAQGSETPLGEPAGPAENDPAFFGDDPFAAERAASVGTLGAPPSLPDAPADALSYAKNLLMDGRFADAELAFSQFQERFPGTPEAAEALYWQGETQFARDDFEAAKNSYIDALQADPAGARAPDAMVALAASLQGMRLTGEACNILSEFPRQYPNASLAVRSKAERVRQSAGCH